MLIRKTFGISFKLQPLSRIIFYFKNSWHYFISDFASNAYTSASVFILGFIAGNAVVGYYRAARHPVDGLPEFPARVEERVVGQQLVALAAGERLVAAQVRGEGAGLDGHE